MARVSFVQLTREGLDSCFLDEVKAYTGSQILSSFLALPEREAVDAIASNSMTTAAHLLIAGKPAHSDYGVGKIVFLSRDAKIS